MSFLTFKNVLISIVLLVFSFTCTSNSYCTLQIDLERQDQLNLFSIMQNLLPLVLDEKQFIKPDNKNVIISNIDELEQVLNRLQNHKDIAPITFRISSAALTRHVKAAKKAFIGSDYIYSRSLLKSLPASLRSYYNHDDYMNSSFPTINKELFTSEFDLAEFYYMLRNYKAAFSNYETFIANNFDKEQNNRELQTALERILAIHLQEYRNPVFAVKILKDYQQKFVFPEYISVYINEWLKGLEIVQGIFKDSNNDSVKANSTKNTLTFEEIKVYIDEYFHGSQNVPSAFIIPKSDQIFYLMLSGYLNDCLYANPKKDEILALLYWSSLCDRVLNYHDNRSVADLYLKECIIIDPKSPYAKKCLTEYEEFMTLSYSGIDGEVPEYLIKEIQFLRDLVYSTEY